MTFHLIALFSGLASQAEAASPNLRALWKESSATGPKECVKVHTTKAGGLTLKVVRNSGGQERGTVFKCTQQDEVYCGHGQIVRVDVWSGTQDQLWEGTIFTNKNDGSYQQMTPTQKWNPHWMAGGPCNNSSPIAVTGKYNNTCQVCTCQRTGSGRLCSLIPQSAPTNWCIVPNKANFVAPSWGPKPAAFVAPQPAPAPRTTPRPAVNTCPNNKPTGQPCRTNCDCMKTCNTVRLFGIFAAPFKCC